MHGHDSGMARGCREGRGVSDIVNVDDVGPNALEEPGDVRWSAHAGPESRHDLKRAGALHALIDGLDRESLDMGRRERLDQRAKMDLGAAPVTQSVVEMKDTHARESCGERRALASNVAQCRTGFPSLDPSSRIWK